MTDRATDRVTDTEVRIRYRDRELTAHEGQTVAAALMAGGVQSWRTTRGTGRPRGLFCGIGVCYDCLVEIDGHADQRACLVEVADGMVVGPAREDAEDVDD
jgi:predicted molibdopterin-dependent oxidoreductase YjgC